MTATLSETFQPPRSGEPGVPESFVETFLPPAEIEWGGPELRIRTVLGSCVAICLWHPGARVGGMCHYALPGSPPAGSEAEGNGNAPRQIGRYSDDAVAELVRLIERSGHRKSDFVVKVFGGGSNDQAQAQGEHVAARNVAAVYEHLIKDFGTEAAAADLGDKVYRNVVFDLWDGAVYVKRTLYDPLRRK